MPDRRRQLVLWLLLPAIVIASGILGYYTVALTRSYVLLGEQTISQSLLLVAQQRAQALEQYIVGASSSALDAMSSVDFSSPATTWLNEVQWPAPGVEGLAILDDRGVPLTVRVNGSASTQREFRRQLMRTVRPQLNAAELLPGQLKHLHIKVGDDDWFLAYQLRAVDERRVIFVARHDPDYLIKNVFPTFFPNIDTQPLYGVVDEADAVRFGDEINRVGHYVVRYRFPETLYAWTLLVAPRQGALLQAREASRRRSEVALPIASFLIVLLGVLFLAYATAKEHRLNLLKSEFIANVSHELKTPLSVIRMFAEMLRSDRVPTTEKKKQYLESICLESERLTALIDNVLDFSALEQGKETYTLQLQDVGTVVSRAVETFRYRAEQEGVAVEMRLAEKMPLAYLDHEAMMLALINLLDNALKYGEGSSPIEVITALSGRTLCIHVRDHGPGIPDEAQKRVFERFYRVRHDGHSRGSGIGLSLVQHIMEAHNGRAKVRNAEGGGAQFTLELPVP